LLYFLRKGATGEIITVFWTLFVYFTSRLVFNALLNTSITMLDDHHCEEEMTYISISQITKLIYKVTYAMSHRLSASSSYC